jgi:hypothetical protein
MPENHGAVLMADGQAKAIDIVFTAIHDGHPDPELLAYQYLQALPKIAEGQGSQVWMIPSELTKALNGFASAFGSSAAPTPRETNHAPLPPAVLHRDRWLAASPIQNYRNHPHEVRRAHPRSCNRERVFCSARLTRRRAGSVRRRYAP